MDHAHRKPWPAAGFLLAFLGHERERPMPPLRALVLFTFLGCGSPAPAPAPLIDGPWFTAWAAPQHARETPEGMNDSTVRMMLRPSVAGEALKIKLENTVGTGAGGLLRGRSSARRQGAGRWWRGPTGG